MRYCHHCGAEVGPQAEVCDECDGDLFEPPEDLGVEEETEPVDAEAADVDGVEGDDGDADAAPAADADDPVAEAEAGDAEAETDAEARADAATEGDAVDDQSIEDDGDDGATAGASDDEQGFVAKIKGLFQ
ncbi:MAG TPA: hypothetical protein VKM69_07505 [Natronoarchaeum rubrum]|nr:hypothetical protein [Natronoarchaeum rubrum]